MAALQRQFADAAGEADQRRVPSSDVLEPELGHREVEHREPAALCEHGQGDDQGGGEEGDGGDERPRRT